MKTRTTTTPIRRTTTSTGLIVGAAAVAAFGALEMRAQACVQFPGPNQVTVWVDNFSGTCRTFEIGSYPSPADMAPVSNDSVSSIRVGSNVRALLLHDQKSDHFGGGVALFEPGASNSLNGSGFAGLGPNLENQTSAVIVSPKSGVSVASHYLGSYPSDRSHQLSTELQGVCHTGTDWIFSRNKNASVVNGVIVLKPGLFRVPRSTDLNVDNPAAGNPTLIPDVLWNLGYNHFGDPDCNNGFVFVPVENEDTTKQAAVAVFRGSDLGFVNWDVFYRNDDNRAGWVAIDPNPSLDLRHPGNDLLASRSTLSATDVQGIFRYTIDWAQVRPGGGFIFSTASPVPPILNRFGAQMDNKSMQGGVFNDTGTLLYLTNSEGGTNAGTGIFVYRKTGQGFVYVAETGNNFGLFNYETSCCGQEQEGLDYLHTTSAATPHIDGDLHAILLNNNAFGGDAYWFKHYSLP